MRDRDGEPADHTSSAGWQAGRLTFLIAGLAVFMVLGALVLIARNLGGARAEPVSAGASTPATTLGSPSPSASPTPSMIPGTDIPTPPLLFGFGATDYAGLIQSPVNAYLLVQTTSGDPIQLKGQITDLMDYYQATMPGLGWSLDQGYPLKLETEAGDPSDWYAAGQDWSNGVETIKISVGNYAQWYDWGYQLTFTVYASDNVMFSDSH